jgi:uncharacterized protein YndB with AHSA1/START domain
VKTSLDVTVEVEIARPIFEVWSYLSDLDRIPELISEITAVRVESERPVGLGTTIHYTVDGDRSGTFEIVDWDPPNRLAWDGPPLRWAGGAARPRGSQTLSALADGHTRLVSRYQPELSGAQVLLLPYLRRWLRRVRRQDAQALKARLEKGLP